MTITHSSTRLVASVAGVAVAAALIAGAFAVQPAKAALSSSQVAAIISLLQSFGADSTTIANVQASLTGGTPTGGSSSTGGTGAACYTWTRDLQQGSTGADVTALQVFLNSNSATMVAASGAGSAGMETSTFGPATKAAVMKFQTASGITPAAGYFGPVTRAAVAAKCSSGGTGSTPSTPSGPLSGGEGELQINDTLGDVESDVDEGASDEKVLGVEVEAQDSDVMIERIDVDMTLSGTGSAQLDNYVDSVSLWLDGKKLASMDVDEADEQDSDVFSFRFSGLKGVVREDDTANLYVAIDAVSNVDSGDSAKNIDVEIPEDGIRAVDAAGISDTYVSSSDNLTEQFSVGEQTGGDAEVTEGDTNPNGQVVTVDEDDDTDGVQVLAFDLEAGNQDITVDDIPVGLVGSTTVNGNARLPLGSAVKRAILKKGGTTIDTKSIPSTAGANYQVVFDDLNLDINDGDTEEFTVWVDMANTEPNGSHYATSTTLYATTTGSNAAWDVEDDSGDNVTPTGSVNNSGDLLVFQTEGISIKLVSVNETKTFAADVAPQADIAEFQIVVDITANGEDMYIDKTATRDDVTADGVGSAGNGFMWATTTESTTGTTSIAATVTASGSTSGDSSNNFKINDGQTRRFTLTVSLQAAANGVAAVKLTGVNWSKTDTATDANFFNSNMSDFKTDLMTLIKL